jgi:hypothetical protein
MTMRAQSIFGLGALLAYVVIFGGLQLCDLFRERRLQKKLGKDYEGPLAD